MPLVGRLDGDHGRLRRRRPRDRSIGEADRRGVDAVRAHLIPLVTSVVVSILVSQASRETREAEVRELNQILERLDSVDRRLEGLESR